MDRHLGYVYALLPLGETYKKGREGQERPMGMPNAGRWTSVDQRVKVCRIRAVPEVLGLTDGSHYQIRDTVFAHGHMHSCRVETDYGVWTLNAEELFDKPC
jgi:hypothetical protein